MSLVLHEQNERWNKDAADTRIEDNQRAIGSTSQRHIWLLWLIIDNVRRNIIVLTLKKKTKRDHDKLLKIFYYYFFEFTPMVQ